MAFAHYIRTLPTHTSIFTRYTNSFSSSNLNTRSVSNFPKNLSIRQKASVKAQASEASAAADAFTILLPITDRNPYLSEGSRQAAATAAAMAKKYGADITVVGGYQEFKLLERLGEGSKPTAIIGEVADDMNLDMVIMSMEAIHSKHVDANLLAEFIPCPVLLLPL